MKPTMTIFMPKARFQLGEVFLTPNAVDLVGKTEIAAAIFRHAQCDWGDFGPDDFAENEHALEHGGSLHSAYITEDGEYRFYVITEADRSVTTVLMTDEY